MANNKNVLIQLFESMMVKKKWWLIPVIVMILIVAVLIVFGQGSILSPFIYPLL
jgi:hypothetical protein